MCFRGLSNSQIPKKLNNIQFYEVLALWEVHVVNNAVGESKEVLHEQYKAMRPYHDFRNALVHGMWDWSQAASEKITATRIRKREVRRTHFTADDLASFASVLETINFKVRYPGGLKEYAAAMAEQGPYMSRRWFCLMTRFRAVWVLIRRGHGGQQTDRNSPKRQASAVHRLGVRRL
jgi:hypothetical protein